MESKVGKLNADQLVPVPVGLSQLIDLVKNDIFKKNNIYIYIYLYIYIYIYIYIYAKIKNIEDKIPDITSLATNTIVNAKIDEAKKRKT